MQVPAQWTPPTGVLGELVTLSRARAAHAHEQRSRLVDAAAARAGQAPSFAAALRGGADVRVIAELKRRSPSQGDLAPQLDAGAQASAFARGGAAAISVLTEPTRFGGDLRDLPGARVGGIPMLRKDFIVDEIQLLEAAAYGASAVLLIVRALPPAALSDLHATATALGLDVLVEVHDAPELGVALDAAYPIVGVNNRNLETLAIDTATSQRLIPQIPADRIAVFESGIHTRADATLAADVGADALLVGSSISRQHDAAAAVAALCHIPRRPRVG